MNVLAVPAIVLTGVLLAEPDPSALWKYDTGG